jgi:hypothetical protein
MAVALGVGTAVGGVIIDRLGASVVVHVAITVALGAQPSPPPNPSTDREVTSRSSPR